MHPSHWYLHNITLTNLLGFSGSRTVAFTEGLQVIHADNHEGKTSLALAMLWCLTGQLPSIGRIAGNKFKLKHKAAGDKDLGTVELLLGDGKGNSLLIRRTVKTGAKTAKLTVKLNDRDFADAEAQGVIDDAIGLNHNSMEGCSIVLQDQRLSLITGDMKKTSEVIHEILGLSVLAKLIPILNDKISQLGKLVKDYEQMDPRKKWEQRHQMLAKELTERELDAAANGCDPQAFRQSQFLSDEFDAIYKELGIPIPNSRPGAKDAVAVLRQAVQNARTQTPQKAKQNELTAATRQLKEAQDKIVRAKAAVAEASNAFTAAANRYKVGRLDIEPKLADLEASLASKQEALSLLKEQQGIYVNALSLLEQQENLSRCPLCSQSVDRDKLLHEVRGKVEKSAADLIAKQENDIRCITEEKALIEELQRECRQWERAIRQGIQEAAAALKLAGKEEELTGLSEHPLCRLPDIAAAFSAMEATVHKALEDALTELAQLNNHIRHYEDRLTPYDKRLDRVAMYLIPIHDVHNKLLEHDNLKGIGETQSSQFTQLLEKARSYHRQLSEFKNLLQVQEAEKANHAIAGHQDFVSRFFVRVAGNPLYDTIAITAEQMHGSVKYDFEASSSKSPSYSDAAKHVLSGGDLSCACLGLVLSLMKGKANKTSFLVLDDPGESLDAIRMDNLADALKGAEGQQTIVLTHQREFAEKLRQAGAAAVTL